jgi:hypothetical protein
VRRKTFGAFFSDSLAIAEKLVQDNARHNELDDVEPEQFLNDTECCGLLGILCDV